MELSSVLGTIYIILFWIFFSGVTVCLVCLIYCCCRMCRRNQQIKVLKRPINQTYMETIEKYDKNLEKCSLCKNESAIYRFNCGCKLCEQDSRILKIENKKCKGACLICNKSIKEIIQIAFVCNICLSVTSRIFKLSCGCSLMICKNCINRIINSKKCPQCRKMLK